MSLLPSPIEPSPSSSINLFPVAGEKEASGAVGRGRPGVGPESPEHRAEGGGARGQEGRDIRRIGGRSPGQAAQ